MKKILVTGRTEIQNGLKKIFVNQDYIDALHKEGAITFMVPYAQTEHIEEYVNYFDGLLVTGGKDTDSKYFNESLHPTAVTEESYIEESDIALIQAFRKQHKPILGICRGIQIINVALGGSLIQDLNSEGNIPIDYHYQSKQNPPIPSNETSHIVYFTEGTQFYKIFGKEHKVNSFHHQAIRRLAEGLVISGTSTDGIIEAVEIPNELFAVQWHPEKINQDPLQQKIFHEFIKLCK